MPTVTYSNVTGRIWAEKRGGTRRVTIGDPLGNVRALAGSTGALAHRYTYWPYGAVRSGDPTQTSQLYSGTLGPNRDSSSRTHMGVRELLVGVGRWSSIDWYWPLQFRYAYASCSPFSRIDPLGLKPYHNPPPVPYDNGNITYSEWPFLSLEDLPWKYAHYCGSKNKWGCDDRPEPRDCVDQACQIHDDCLEVAKLMDPGYYLNSSGRQCHCQLMRSAANCSFWGCFTHNGGSLLGIIQCKAAAKTIMITFAAICGVASGKGVFDWVADTIGSVRDTVSDWFSWLRGPR
ncbi:MAG: hypothetical protein HONBIEJF_02533 [Fimbriimonadaceae bacterium]|nr:hypothetical protein [Fimbriimonadaceae bacterium]